jgi:hypothetical protein
MAVSSICSWGPAAAADRHQFLALEHAHSPELGGLVRVVEQAM